MTVSMCMQRERESERGADSLGVWFHPCGLGQEAVSMLGNEVTGQSVNTHGSLWPWPGGEAIALQ